jgi:hypothetical protein
LHQSQEQYPLLASLEVADWHKEPRANALEGRSNPAAAKGANHNQADTA